MVGKEWFVIEVVASKHGGHLSVCDHGLMMSTLSAVA